MGGDVFTTRDGREMASILSKLSDFIWESIGLGSMWAGNYMVLKRDRREGTWWGEHSEFFKLN